MLGRTATEKSIMLISFYNPKALGVRYLEKSLKDAGYQVYIVFMKAFNSKNPEKVTEMELELLRDVINQVQPGLIGLSVMTTLYLETVFAVNKYIRSNFKIPIVWGGVYPTLFPEECLKHADFVIRGEGEKAIVELAGALGTWSGALYNNSPNRESGDESTDNNNLYRALENIQNLAYMKTAQGKALQGKDQNIVINEMAPLCQNLDAYGYPEIGGDNKFYIDNNRLIRRDPQQDSISYELATSRGCPFSCTYCCTPSIRRIYSGKGKYVRFRSVDSVISELVCAKKNIKRLKIIRFWDEIFPGDDVWIDEFARRYKREINLPFEIWVHPLKIKYSAIKKLVDAGLYKAVMGIQSGSVRIRREIFGRYESQEDIINASKILSECRVPRIVYDFILGHPFETEEDIRQSFDLCMKLEQPFELQLHSLNFFPGTDIVKKAVEHNVISREKLEKIMYGPIKEQYRSYWEKSIDDTRINFWYSLIYMTQFKSMRPLADLLSKHSFKYSFPVELSIKLQKSLLPVSRIRDYMKKLYLILHEG